MNRNEAELESAKDSTFDLALDVLPCGNGASLIGPSETGFERLTGRRAVRSARQETAGWELTQDVVYDR